MQAAELGELVRDVDLLLRRLTRHWLLLGWLLLARLLLARLLARLLLARLLP
jgi:hypothetical protein